MDVREIPTPPPHPSKPSTFHLPPSTFHHPHRVHLFANPLLFNMKFNHNFAEKDEEELISEVRSRRGCFNVNCADPSANKSCTKCHVAVYCSRECQMTDWQATDSSPHKKVCKVYRDNVSDAKLLDNGGKGAAAIGLLSVELIDEDQCIKAMQKRCHAFLKEAKRCIDIDLQNDKFGFRKATIGLAASVVYNIGKARLQVAATIHDEESEIGFGRGVTINHIIFEAVDDECGDEVRNRLHPPQGGLGNISIASRVRVVERLKVFFQQANNRYGISIQSVNYGRGLSWMGGVDFSDEKKELEDANGGNLIIWMPHMGS